MKSYVVLVWTPLSRVTQVVMRTLSSVTLTTFSRGSWYMKKRTSYSMPNFSRVNYSVTISWCKGEMEARISLVERFT